MTIIDTHAHVDHLEDLPNVLARAAEAHVSDIVAMSVDLDSMRSLLNIVGTYKMPRIHPALGVHPGKVKPEIHDDVVEFMKAHIDKAIAVGETGLDYWYKWVRKDEVERKKQKDSFGFHLDFAKQHDLPIVIHSRGAWRECLAMAQAAGTTRALFHWYSGPVDVMTEILDAGYYVSTSPSVGYSEESKAAMRAAPLDRILIETDAPVNYRDPDGDYVAEPKDIWKTLTHLSALKQADEVKVLEQVNTNARKFFGIVL